jgi:hypothetical protein
MVEPSAGVSNLLPRANCDWVGWLSIWWGRASAPAWCAPVDNWPTFSLYYPFLYIIFILL